MKVDFNQNWKFYKVGGTPVAVSLPHDAMITEKRDVNCGNGVNSGYFPGGKYVYEKSFSVAAENMEKSFVLHFEGVYQNCTVFVNGKEAGSHRYGYTAFDVDMTGTVLTGENHVKVLVDNSLEPNCRWYSGSGIYRPVWLWIRDRRHIESVQVETVSVKPAVISIAVTTTQEMPAEIAVYDKERLVAAGQPGNLEIPNAVLWSAEQPYLYRLVVTAGNDVRELQIGIRKLQWNAKDGLTVNGERVLLAGGCIHHDHGVLGACEFYAAEERRLRILKESGFNAVRIAHHPASQIVLELCDRLGMYVMNETFDGWYLPKTYHDYSRWFEAEWKKDVEAMVEASRNHPSVIMYSVGNEVSETATKKGAEICKMLTDYVHRLDDTRPVTAGINVLLNVYTNMGIGIYKEKGDYKPEPLSEKKGYHERKSGSAFFNAMANKLGSLMFSISAGKRGDRAVRGAANALDVLGLNYAASQYDYQVEHYPNQLMVGAETMVADLPYNWERVRKYPQLFGDFVWSAWDYLGEACIGDWTYHSYKGLPLLAGQGMIDITGRRLAAMYYMQVVWGIRKEPFLAVRPLNHAGEVPSTGAWQFTNAIDSWEWNGYEGVKTVVEVYSNAHSVRLILNGAEVAVKKIKKYKTSFLVVYEPGVLMAEALDETGQVISSHCLTSAKEETVLTVLPEVKKIKADGQDLCYVSIEFTDKNGILKPYIEQRVELETEGPGTLAGFGSALCKTDEVFHQKQHCSYRGRCLAVLRAGVESGILRLTASSKGVAPVTVEIEVEKYENRS